MMQSLLYGGSVESRLAASHVIFGQLAEQLQNDLTFMNKLKSLTHHARAVANHMAEMQLGPLCIRCSSQTSGGCCSLFMAGETDALQMLMNILAGIEVRQVRNDGRECCFLGETGCIFLFKPMFCLNYNCTHIHKAATSFQMQELERLTGVVLTKQYELEQVLLACIRRESGKTKQPPSLDFNNSSF